MAFQLQVNLQALIGLGATLGIGFVVGPFLHFACRELKTSLPAPSESTCDGWQKLVDARSAGWYIGLLERIIFLLRYGCPEHGLFYPVG